MKKFLLFILSVSLSMTSISQIVKTQVGATSYDLQTNNSITRRIVLDPTTGKVVVTYTGAGPSDNVAGNFPTRGTGYYYFNGSGTPSTVTTFPGRVEPERVGWGSPLFLAGGKEAIFSHASGTSSGIHMSNRGVIGTGTWTHTKVTAGNETWPRVANSGDSIVLVSSMFTPGNLFGMLGGVGIMRSTNGGTTWLPNTGTLDSIGGINVETYPNWTRTDGTQGCIIGGDQYALDVNGSKIAVLTGGLDISLYRSNDFGNTWTKTTLISGNNDQNATDTSLFDNRSSGDYSVLIDNSGVTHCFWGLSIGSNQSSLRFGSGIMYWNSSMGNKSPYLIGKTAYGKESSPHALTFIPALTVLNNANGSNPKDAQGAYGIGNSGHPSSGIDASGNIYLSYSRIRGFSDTNRFLAGKLTDISGLFFTDCYIVKSTDGGNSWIGPLNVSDCDSLEDAFPSIARNVDANAHIMYQQDSLFGHALGAATTESHKGTTTHNKIIYARVPVSDIVDQPDNAPPILRLNDNFTRTFSADSFPMNTFEWYAGCANMLNTGIAWTNAKDFTKKYLVTAMDDSTQSELLVIDTPDGIKMNIAGTYRIIVYAKDASGKVSERVSAGTAPRLSTGLLYGSWDTMTFYIKILNTDANPPIITLSTKQLFVYKGTPFTVVPSAVAIDDNKCGTPSMTLPLASVVDVNTVNKYTLQYSAKDAAQNIAKDSCIVYVYDLPIPAVDQESIVINGSTKTMYASAKSSTNTKLFPEFVDKYQWSVKKGTAVSTLGRNKDTIIENVTTKTFDSVCVEITNQWTIEQPLKKAKPKCVPLKNGIAIQSANGEVSILVYPNPTNGAFNVQINGNKKNDARITLTTMDGKTVLDNSFKINNTAIPFNNNLPTGIYYMTMEVDGVLYKEKLEVK